jgi:hypothetical protein
MKYNEVGNVKDVVTYIKSTYNQHYVGGDSDGTQVLDLLHSIGIAETFCQANAIKYVTRFGRKNGKNKNDLLKAIHYVLLLMYFSENNNGEISNED